MKIRWRKYGSTLLFAASTNVMATQLPYRLWTEVKSDGDAWTVVPHVAAPAGSALRYQILGKKAGRSGRSITSQSGHVTVGEEGYRALASIRIGVGADSLCAVDVTVFDGNDQVGNLTLHLPR